MGSNRCALLLAGPGETYCDLCRHASFGLWHSRASQEVVPHIRPQEQGNHYGVAHLAVEDAFRITAERPFACNLLPYSTMELFTKRHFAELSKDGFTHIRIDYKNSGVGSNSCGPELLEQYRLAEKDIHFAFRLERNLK